MNNLVLVGNGFDLAHGLKTKYSDFILWYLNKAFNSHSLNGIYDDNLIKIDSSSRIMLKNFTSINNFFEKIKTYKFNLIFKHDLLKNIIYRAQESNWVDIESMYYSFLINLYKQIEKDNSDYNDSIYKELDKLNECFEFIKTELIEYLTAIDNSIDTKKKKIDELLINNLGLNRNLDNQHTLFLNFNYTSTLDMYVNSYNLPNIKTIHIHGKLNDSKKPIIFGYGDEMDYYYEKIERLNSNEFLKNIKSFWYFKTNNYQSFSKFIENDDFTVYILGHSCGISDRILLNSIFENKHCKLIKIFYHKKNSNENDYFEKTQEISRHFKPSNKAIMRLKILPFSECAPLLD